MKIESNLSQIQMASCCNQVKTDFVKDDVDISSSLNNEVHSKEIDSGSFDSMKPNGFRILNGVKTPCHVERLQRSRERNRMHARKTRQRKKQAMQALQLQLEALKEDQIRLRQSINEKNTANILVGLFSSDGTKGVEDNPDVEILLRRQPEDIPDASNIPELPALILPGHHNSKKSSQAGFSFSSENDADDVVGPDSVFPDDGIDYQLLRKDRSKCTAAELDQIRRERNRMHAKRTRDRKRIMMEEMEKIIRKLEKENNILKLHLQSLFSNSDEGSVISPDSCLTPLSTGNDSRAVEQVREHSEALSKKRQDREKLLNHLECLLMAAGAFENSEGGAIMSSNSANTTSDSTSAEISAESSGSEDDNPQPKRKKVDLAFIRQPIII